MSGSTSLGHKFSDLSIATKLFLMAGVLIFFMVLVGVLGLMNLSSSASKGSDMYRGATMPIEHLDAVRSDLATVDTTLLTALKSGTGASRYVPTIQSAQAAFEKDLKAYTSSSLSAAEQHVYGPFQSNLTRYKNQTATLINDFQAATPQSLKAANTLYDSTAGPLNNAMDQQLAQLTTVNDQQAAIDNQSLSANYSSSRTLSIIIIALAVLLGGAVAFFIARLVKRAANYIIERVDVLAKRGVGDLVQGLEGLTRGDLTERFQPATEARTEFARDELGKIDQKVEEMRNAIVTGKHSYNEAADKLSQMLGQVSSTAGSVGEASQQMASTSDETGKASGEVAQAIGEIAQGTERQAQMVERTRGEVDEVARAVSESAENAQRTAEVAHDARSAAQEGVEAAEKADAAMRSVRDSSAAVSSAISELASKSDQIGAIVQTITGIAEQTNLLALNAAIEAARAGDQGRGFAVVAEEVRKLAEESQRAAEEISGLIGAIQQETTGAVDVVEDGARRTEEGVEVVEQTRTSFERIGAAVDDMTSRIEQIAAVSQQIAASANSMQSGITEVAAIAEQSSASTEEVSASSEQTSASAQEIAASAQELSGNAELLNRLVAQFKLTPSGGGSR